MLASLLALSSLCGKAVNTKRAGLIVVTIVLGADGLGAGWLIKCNVAADACPPARLLLAAARSWTTPPPPPRIPYLQGTAQCSGSPEHVGAASASRNVSLRVLSRLAL